MLLTLLNFNKKLLAFLDHTKTNSTKLINNIILNILTYELYLHYFELFIGN